MSHRLSFPPGWNLEIPAGTMLIRVDVVMNSRPGAGGYCAIIEAADLQDIIILRGGEPESDTLRMMKLLAVRSEEHTSELQSLMRISYAVFCLKKKKNNNK